MEENGDINTPEDRFRDRFVFWCTLFAIALNLVLIVIDARRGNINGVYWETYYIASIGTAYALYRYFGDTALYIAVIDQMIVVHILLVEHEYLLLGYIWLGVFPLATYYLAGLKKGLIITGGMLAAVIGVMVVRDPVVPGLTVEADVLVHLIAIMGAGALFEWSRATYEQRLRESLVTDELTQIPNRRRFNQAIEEEVRRSKRYERPLSLVLFDLDHFKLINDTAGHPAGDRVLREIARISRESIRETDLVCRLGGDEFAIIAPETNGDGSAGALVLAQRLREAVESFDFEVGAEVTITLGVTHFRNGDTAESMIKRADDALYRAKEAGRNRVVALQEQS